MSVWNSIIRGDKRGCWLLWKIIWIPVTGAGSLLLTAAFFRDITLRFTMCCWMDSLSWLWYTLQIGIEIKTLICKMCFHGLCFKVSPRAKPFMWKLVYSQTQTQSFKTDKKFKTPETIKRHHRVKHLKKYKSICKNSNVHWTYKCHKLYVVCI